MREFSYRPGMQSVMFTGRGNQESIRGIDAAARCLGRRRADMLRVIVEDWLGAWKASGGPARVKQPGFPSIEDDLANPLRGHRVPFRGVYGGGLVIPFRPRLVPAPPGVEPEK
jgi:hypothetical protein